MGLLLSVSATIQRVGPQLRRVARESVWLGMLLFIVNLASAQSPITCSVSTGVPSIVRAEGGAEVLTDLLLLCTGGTPTPAGLLIPLQNVEIALNTDITSTNVGAGGISEALLLIDEPFPSTNAVPPGLTPATGQTVGQLGCLASNSTNCAITSLGPGIGAFGSYNGTAGHYNMFQGTQSNNNTITWVGVPIDGPGATGTRIVRITNIRANVSEFGASSTLIPTTLEEMITVNGSTPLVIDNPIQTVALAEPGLSSALVPGPGVLTQCNTSTTILVTATEGFASSFKPQSYGQVLAALASSYTGPTEASQADQNVPGFLYNTESAFRPDPAITSGTFVDPSGAVGLATQGTQIQLTFAGLGSGVNIAVPSYVYLSGTYPAGVPLGVAVLSGQTPPPVVLGPCTGAPGPNVPLVITGSTASAVYEIYYANSSVVETASFPISVSFSPGPPPAQGTGTVTVSFAPPLSSNSAPVFSQVEAPQTLFSITACGTNNGGPVLTFTPFVAGCTTTLAPEVLSQVVTVTNTGDAGTFTDSITPNCPVSSANLPCPASAFSIQPTSGSIGGAGATTDLTVSFNSAGLPPGVYTATYSVSGGSSGEANVAGGAPRNWKPRQSSSSNQGSAQDTVNGVLQGNPSPLTFNLTSAQPQQMSSLKLDEQSENGFTVPFSASYTPIFGTPSVQISPMSANTPDYVQVTVSAGSLAPGQTAIGAIGVSCTSGVPCSLNIPVTVTAPEGTILTAAVTSITPPSPAASASPQTISVTGMNFISGLTVSLTGPNHSSMTLTGAQIQNVSPGGFQMSAVLSTIGQYSLQVTNPNGGAASLPFNFNVQIASPAISSVSPSSPTASAGYQVITVNGANFEAGLTVTLTPPGGSPIALLATQIQNVTAATFQLRVILASVGAYSLEVTNPDGGMSGLFPFTTAPPLNSNINITGVGNGASFSQSFAPGMLMTVFGSGLSTGSEQIVTSAPLPTTSESGTSLTINGIKAPLTYIASTQINFQLPYEVTPGPANLTVSSGGQSDSVGFVVQASAPGIFVDSSENLVPNKTAAAGSTIGLFVTGAGLVTPPEATGNVPNSGTTPKPNLPVTLTVGGILANLDCQYCYVGIPSWSTGVLQINFTVPPNVPTGSQPVIVTIGGVSSVAALLTVTP